MDQKCGHAAIFLGVILVSSCGRYYGLFEPTGSIHINPDGGRADFNALFGPTSPDGQSAHQMARHIVFICCTCRMAAVQRPGQPIQTVSSGRSTRSRTTKKASVAYRISDYVDRGRNGLLSSDG